MDINWRPLGSRTRFDFWCILKKLKKKKNDQKKLALLSLLKKFEFSPYSKMIELQTFDNFLTPPRFFRPWKAVEAMNDDAAYHFFPPKWRQWLTPEYFIYLLLIISRTRTRPRLRIKGLYYSTITSICTWKTTVLLTYGQAKGKNQ